ncbi:helix-turn-helix domain-containing protein [Paenibacillus sp. GCM10023248]|uniref:helix-turn-helix domain-containing protein n=1 Tax=unclassified Paenibacillus TaxID=185978 RepID=UPI002379E2F7|nr:helix-turn-helix domain-containing protein [Paenibacillus sp. MAHUQ-63]MDD9267172.1 AraC family transcriptional regulator [Paenibacillus sp. MAHUQ-63]
MGNWLNGWRQWFNSGRDDRSGTYLQRLIWVGCLSVCLPIMITGLVYYQFSMERTKEEIIDESQSTLLMTKDRAERLLQGIETDSLQLAADPLMTDLFAGRITDMPLIWHLDLVNKITLVKNTNNFIKEIYFYSTLESVVLTNNYGSMELEHYKYKADIEQLLNDDSLTKWTYLPSSSQEGLITFVRKVPVGANNHAQGILGLQVDIGEIVRFLPESTAVIPKGKELVFLSALGQPRQGEKPANLEAWSGYETIAAAQDSIGSFYEAWQEGRKAHVSYIKSMFGRTYVSVIPEDIIADKLAWIRVLTIAALLFIITLAAMFTYLSTKRVYSPIEQLIKHSRSLGAGRIQGSENELDYIRTCLDYLNKESQRLGKYMEKVQPTLRERCLQQLVNGDYILSDALLHDCEMYGLTVKATYGVMIVEVENAIRETRFLPSDKPILAFTLANVIQEIMETNPDLQGYVFPYEGRGVALIRWDDMEEQGNLPQRMIAFAQAVSDSLQSCLSFEVSVGIGRCYSHIADVPVSYKEAVVALQYRIYQDTASILYIEDLESSKPRSVFRYPRELEGTIVDSLSKGETKMAEQALEKFTKALQQSKSYHFIHQSYSVLLSAIITSLEKQGGSILDILEHNLFGQLESKRTSRDIIDWFTGVLFPLHKQLIEESLNDNGQSAISQICQHIREHCREDLTLVQCAELVGMSPSYVSRLFKKEMGINFLDFVLECKVEEVKRQLLETDQSISEISSLIGYSERNLTRIFQRKVQMTPSMFRSAYR